MQCGVRSIPTTLIYKDGKPVESLIGVATLSQFKKLVSQNM
ncbi:Thioredoxin (fragment) [Xenorhabdus innexi]|uniref:Thioredoxin n=1 Tax=Xenorhabdus innexi TaxID=290109 RepID=A0A1N6MST3_9GAMM